PGQAAAKTAKKVELKTLSADETFALVKKKAGQVVIIDCWSTYCAPCMKEFPGLLKLQEKYGDRVACISVSLNYSGTGKLEEDQPAVLEFLEKQKATIDNVFSSTESEEFFKAIQDTFKLKDRPGAIPLCLVFDKEGKLVKHQVGFTYAKDVEPVVEKLIGR